MSLLYARDDQRAGIVARELINLPEVNKFCLIHVSDKGLTEICDAAKGRSIASFELIDSPVSDQGLSLLPRLKSVRAMTFNTCPITGSGLSHLKSVKGLRYLWLVEQGTMANPNRFSEPGFYEIGRINELNYLLLFGLSVSDASAAHLENLSNLKLLQFRKCRISDEAISKLRHALPQTKIDTVGPIQFFREN